MPEDVCAGHMPRPAEIPVDGIERDVVSAMIESLVRPDALIEQVVDGPRFIAVMAGGRMGMASLLGARPAEGESRMVRDAIGRRSARIAECLLLPSPFAVCLGMAALNAANSPDPAVVEKDDASAEDLVAELGRNKTVGLVGQFPFVDSLREKVGTLHLFELMDVPGAVPRDRWDEVLSGLDVLAVTGTALLTRQMGYFLTRAARAVSIVLGPTTPLSKALFRFGADHLCGSVVTDPQRVIEGIRSGLPFKAIRKRGGIRFVRLSREDGRA